MYFCIVISPCRDYRRFELPAFPLLCFQEVMRATRDKLDYEMLYCCFRMPATAVPNIVIHRRMATVFDHNPPGNLS